MTSASLQQSPKVFIKTKVFESITLFKGWVYHEALLVFPPISKNVIRNESIKSLKYYNIL